MKNCKVLVSWLGSKDIWALEKADPADTGPLHSMLADTSFGPFSELFLVISADRDEGVAQKESRDRAIERVEAVCARHGTDLGIRMAPENFRAASPEKLQEFMLDELQKVYGCANQRQFFYNITSGTAVMCAIQLNLGLHSAFAGIPLYTMPPEWLPDERGNVFSVQLPSMLSGLKTGQNDESLYIAPNARIYDQARLKVANSDASVLILGETGTGKSALAHYIHSHDVKRRGKALETLNCATFQGDPGALASELFGHVKGAYTGSTGSRPGAFQKADSGTLFLDEAGEMPPGIQGMLLRALDHGMIKPYGSDDEIRVNVRIIAATNVDLYKAISAGAFRADLFYRLAQYTPRLKALREYSYAEKEKLLSHLLHGINQKSHRLEPRTLSPEAKKLLLAHDWPGNIREMKFRLESICLLSSAVITAADITEQLNTGQCAGIIASATLPGQIAPEEQLPESLPGWLKQWEQYWLKSALHHYPAHKDAARRLGLPASTFNSKWGKYGK